MKLDHDLVRGILLAIEASDHEPLGTMDLEMPGKTETLVSYHLCLLHEAGLIEAIDFSSNDGLHWKPRRLTFVGHEFLDGIRDPKTWRYAKNISSKAGSNALEFILDAAKAYARHELRKLTGIDA